MNNMIQVKKASKYGKYFLLLAAASIVSFMWSSKSGHSSILPAVPQAHADVPSDYGFGDGNDDDGADCP